MMWMILADDSEARFFEVKPHDAPAFLEKLEHDEARRRLGVESGHVPGKQTSDFGQQHSFAPNTTLADNERDHFAALIAKRIDEGVAAHRVREVALVMAPKLLGLVRAHLGAQAKKRIVCAVNENRVHAPLADVVAEVRSARGVR